MATSWWFKSTQPHHFFFHFYIVPRSWRNWQTRYFEGVVLTRCMGSSPIDRTIEDQKTMHVSACIVFSLRFTFAVGFVMMQITMGGDNYDAVGKNKTGA